MSLKYFIKIIPITTRTKNTARTINNWTIVEKVSNAKIKESIRSTSTHSK